MGTAVGAFWYALAGGEFVIRRVPWTVPGDPVVTFADGPEGAVIESEAIRSRDEVFNSITVTGERTDGTDPVFYTARDENPSSPTFVGGPFGVRNKLVRLRTPGTQATAKGAADDFLRRTTALVESWSFTCPPDASLELGDVVGLAVRGRTGIVQVVESFTMPMDVAGIMRVDCRSQVIGLLDDLTGFETDG
jgi:hypothetical protein